LAREWLFRLFAEADVPAVGVVVAAVVRAAAGAAVRPRRRAVAAAAARGRWRTEGSRGRASSGQREPHYSSLAGSTESPSVAMAHKGYL
jgi:hypothetical protein